MPTYQYACTNPEGKHEFEVVQSFTDPTVTTCPECVAPVRKVYGSVGVVFKGSGFYRTDSRKTESAAAAGSSSGSKDSSKDSSSGSKESSSKDSSSSSSSKESSGSKETSSSSKDSSPSKSRKSSSSTSGTGSRAAN